MEALLEAEKKTSQQYAQQPEDRKSSEGTESRNTVCQAESQSEDALLDEENPFDNVDDE